MLFVQEYNYYTLGLSKWVKSTSLELNRVNPHDLLSDPDLGLYLTYTHTPIILALSILVVVGVWGLDNTQSFRMIVESMTAEHCHCVYVLIP